MKEEFLPVEERVSRELDMETIEPPLDLAATFGNDHPVELEIGIGKGLFICFAAREHPERNFLGIEISRKYLRKARDRVEKRPLPNVRLICGEAFELMDRFLVPESLGTIHIYFPDPWPKKRHHKRRLFSKEFIALAHSRLVKDGLLLIATDHADYWEWICEVMAAQTLLEPAEILPTPQPGTAGLTNYDIKYKKEGRPIFRAGYRKP